MFSKYMPITSFSDLKPAYQELPAWLKKAFWIWLVIFSAVIIALAIAAFFYMTKGGEEEWVRDQQAKAFAVRLDTSERRQNKLTKKREVIRVKQKKEAENAKKIMDDVDSTGGDFIKQRELRRRIGHYRRTGAD